jgi:DNA-binding CsgD family transcriptional regulator
LSDEEFELARAVCTRQQVRALNLWRRGYGARAIGAIMDLDRSTARQHVRAGLRRLAAAKRGGSC